MSSIWPSGVEGKEVEQQAYKAIRIFRSLYDSILYGEIRSKRKKERKVYAHTLLGPL
jgi:hypothetical protein